jgi:hypothetical protein
MAEPGEPKHDLVHWGPRPTTHPQVSPPLQDLNGRPLYAARLDLGRRRAFTCWLLEMEPRLSEAYLQATDVQSNNTNHSSMPAS